jgi:hypothetical protein
MKREHYIESRVYDEYEYIDIEDATKKMLSDTYSFHCVGGPFKYLSAGDVLFDYNHVAFREECNNFADHMVRNGDWIYYDNEYWPSDAQKLIDEITERIKDVDPFECTGIEHPGWYYYDSRVFEQGPFESAEACYDHACMNPYV